MMHGMAALLLTTVAGYWVLERSQAHKGNLKKVGELLGVAIILLSLLGVIGAIWCPAKPGMGGRGGLCPFSFGKSYPPASPAQ